MDTNTPRLTGREAYLQAVTTDARAFLDANMRDAQLRALLLQARPYVSMRNTDQARELIAKINRTLGIMET